MIGRRRELETILAHVDRAPSPSAPGAQSRGAMGASKNAHRPNVVFVTGEAGIGKSMLLQSVVQQLRSRKGHDRPLIAMTECSTPLLGQDVGQMEALEPWTELLEALVKQDDSQRSKEILALVTKCALAWGHLLPVVGVAFETAAVLKEHLDAAEEKKHYAANQEQMFQQCINLLAKVSEAHPLVLVLDDFHWADTSSTNLLFSAARHLEKKPVTFVVAYRPDDAASSRDGRGHPILHVRNELGRYALFVDVVVPKLAADDLEALLRERYTRYKPNDDFQRWLAERSDGNALFVTQYLSTLEEDGVLSPQTGELRAKFDAVRVPNSASSVVEERIRRLDDDDRELLRYASVEGVTFTSSVLARVMETPRLTLLRRLRLVAEKHGVVRSLGKQRIYGANESTAYQFTNVVLQRTLYDGLEEEEREALHARVYEALESEWKIAPDRTNLAGFAARLSAHAQTHDERLHAAKLLLGAARASWARFAEEETMTALAALRRQTEALGEEAAALDAEARLLRGMVHKLRGRHDDALEDFRAAERMFDARANVPRALEAMMREAFTLENAKRFDEAKSRSLEVLARAEKHGDLRVVSAMLNNLGLVLGALGDADGALDHQRRCLALRERTGDVRGQAVALGSMGLALFAAGRLEESLEHHRRSLALRESIDDRVGQGYSLTNIGNVLAAMERLDEALAHHRRGVALRESLGGIVTLATSLENEACVLSRLGREDEAVACFERALDLAERNALTTVAAKARAELEKRGWTPPPVPTMDAAPASTTNGTNGSTSSHAPPMAIAMEWVMDKFAELMTKVVELRS